MLTPYYSLARSPFCLFCMLIFFCPLAIAGEKGWMLDQVGCYSGKLVTEASKIGIRTHAPRYGLTYIIKAPDWSCAFMNPKSKLFYKITHAQLEKQALFKPQASTQEQPGIKPTLDGEDKVAGRTTKRYKVKGMHTTYFWVTREIDYPPVVLGMVTRRLGIPGGLGVPLKVVRIDPDGKKRVLLDTIKTARIAVTDKLFKTPPDFKEAADEFEVLMSGEEGDESGEDLSELLKNL